MTIVNENINIYLNGGEYIMISYTNNDLNYVLPKEAWEIVSSLTRNSTPNRKMTCLIDFQGEYREIFQKICSTDKVTVIFENGFKKVVIQKMSFKEYLDVMDSRRIAHMHWMSKSLSTVDSLKMVVLIDYLLNV